jgi:hypothetical protein
MSESDRVPAQRRRSEPAAARPAQSRAASSPSIRELAALEGSAKLAAQRRRIESCFGESAGRGRVAQGVFIDGEDTIDEKKIAKIRAAIESAHPHAVAAFDAVMADKGEPEDIAEWIKEKIGQSFVKVVLQIVRERGTASAAVGPVPGAGAGAGAGSSSSGTSSGASRGKKEATEEKSESKSSATSRPGEMEDPIVARIVTALDAGHFGVRWLTLRDARQKQVVRERIAALARVYREIREAQAREAARASSSSSSSAASSAASLESEASSAASSAASAAGAAAAEVEEAMFVVHGSILWGAASETPGDIDVIDPAGDRETHTVKVGHFRNRPASDEVELKPEGSPLDSMLGVHFDAGSIETGVAFGSAAAIADGAAQLWKAALRELKSKPQLKKGARKAVNVAIVIQHFINQQDKAGILDKAGSDDVGKFDADLKPLIDRANRSLTSGETVIPNEAQCAAIEKWLAIMQKVVAAIAKRRAKKKKQQVEKRADASSGDDDESAGDAPAKMGAGGGAGAAGSAAAKV